MKTRANGYKRGRESVAESVSPPRTRAAQGRTGMMGMKPDFMFGVLLKCAVMWEMGINVPSRPDTRTRLQAQLLDRR
jgi:hypothetical protein